METKTVPHNPEAEEAVLGSILIDPETFDTINAILNPADFYYSKHRWIFESLARLRAGRQSLDFLTLTTDLQQHDHLEAVGGAAYVSQLINAVPSAVSAEHYAHLVEQTATRRRLLDAASAIARLAYDETTALNEVLNESETAIFRARRQRTGIHARHIQDVSQSVIDELQLAQNTQVPLVFSTGYTDLDRLFKLRRGELSLIAARTSMGKTALLLNIAQRAALAKLRVLFFSLEMTAEALVHRLVVSEGRVTLDQLATGIMPQQTWTHVIDDLAKHSELPLWIDATPANSSAAIRAQSLRQASEHGVDLLCVDYVQLVRGEKSDRRYQEIGSTVRTLKALALELRVPVLAAAQLSRDAENNRPTLSDLRESGDLEQDSDNVLFIHRAREATGNVLAEIIVAKQRQGPPGVCNLVWIPKRVAFVPKARQESVDEHCD